MSTQALGASLLSSLALVGMLGFRHGFDADHIAVVDGMTRARQLHHSYWTSRLVGLQFALGHSAAILLASLLLYRQSVALPQWLDGLGMVISTVFLLVIAASNFAHALRPAAGPAPIGPVTATLLRLTGRQLHPALVGMAFAMSFDSLAQAAFFASRGSEFSGLSAVVLLAAVFGLGMMLADATNGALLNWFAGRSDRLARQASRFSSGFIALIALLTAGAGLLRGLESGFAQTWDDMGLWIGVGLLATTSLVYAARIAVQRARPPSTVAVR
jgi:nickel/cobalt transporter (NiCoT) family protein